MSNNPSAEAEANRQLAQDVRAILGFVGSMPGDRASKAPALLTAALGVMQELYGPDLASSLLQSFAKQFFERPN